MENGENVWKKLSATFDIKLDGVIVTYKTAARILLSIVEFLSFNRNQIPLAYETFNLLVQNLEKLLEKTNNVSELEVQDFAMERQRDVAIQTNRRFHDISNVRLFQYFKKCKQFI